MLIPNSIQVWQENDEYLLEWKTSEPGTEVDIEPLTIKDKESIRIIRENSNRARVRGLSQNQRHFFLLRDQYQSSAVGSTRRMEMVGTPNFRDFGGYYTLDGRMVKWETMFRSGHLIHLTDADLVLLDRLNLHLICDFREVKDQHLKPNRLPVNFAGKVMSCPITPGSHLNLIESARSNKEGSQAMADIMIQINLDFIESQADAYGRMFEAILSGKGKPFLIHCAAGKDRTGFAAALILLALGVPKRVVLSDYMLTTRYFEPELEFEKIQQTYGSDLEFEQLKPLLEVNERYLTAALDEIERRYQSVERYLKNVLGVDNSAIVELRKRYLE